MSLFALRESADGDYVRHMQVESFNDDTLRKAKYIFNEYRQRGVVVSGNFDDMSWTLTNEANNMGMTLLTFEGGLKKPAMKWIGCTYPQYIVYVKTYIVFNFGELCLASLQKLSRFFNKMALVIHIGQVARSELNGHAVTLLKLIPGGNESRDAMIEELEEILEIEEKRRYKTCSSRQRQLADFKSYLRFNEVLDVFWINAGKIQKLFYFPLYFWWKLTAILPLRPMELLLTPRDCLRVCGSDAILTIRRTKLKGSNEKIEYRIASDYLLREYVISENLAYEVDCYIAATKNMAPTELGTLFLIEPHQKHLNYAGSASRYYTYQMLTTCMNYFYEECISCQPLDISQIRLGDTRHLAMTNLIISGGSPMVCRELAGHSDIEVSSHYYSNTSNLVECATLEKLRRIKGDATDLSGESRYPIAPPKNLRRVSEGWCSSELMQADDISDCLSAFGIGGYLGDCRSCSYFFPDNPGITLKFFDEKTAKKRVDDDSRFLIQMIELVRKGLGQSEDINAALLRLQHSSNHYSKCLLEKHSKEDGVKWLDHES